MTLSDKLTPAVIIGALVRGDYPLFAGDYNLTLVGIRSNNRDANTFNDVLVVLFSVGLCQNMLIFPMTSDPGVFYREHPLSDDGTAVLVPGHYRGCWQSGMHRGQYPALVQVGDVAVYRDNNKDDAIDLSEDSIETGLFGINLHRSNSDYESSQVDRWSAGCQVLSSPFDFGLLMALIERSTEIYGEKFSYTLLTEDQL